MPFTDLNCYPYLGVEFSRICAYMYVCIYVSGENDWALVVFCGVNGEMGFTVGKWGLQG